MYIGFSPQQILLSIKNVIYLLFWKRGFQSENDKRKGTLSSERYISKLMNISFLCHLNQAELNFFCLTCTQEFPQGFCLLSLDESNLIVHCHKGPEWGTGQHSVEPEVRKIFKEWRKLDKPTDTSINPKCKRIIKHLYSPLSFCPYRPWFLAFHTLPCSVYR